MRGRREPARSRRSRVGIHGHAGKGNTVIDANAAIQQVRSGTAPPSWQVLRARPTFFMWSAIGGVVFTLAAIAAAIYLFVSNTVVGIGVTDQTPPNVALFWLIVDMLVLAACAVIGVVSAVRHVRRLGSASEQMLVLMPEGFVLRRGTTEKDVTTINYQRIATMTPTAKNGAMVLAMTIAGSGKRAAVTLDNRFGPAKKLASEIAGTHAHYVSTARASAQAPQ